MDTKLSSEFADDEAVPFTKLLNPLRGYENKHLRTIYIGEPYL